MNDTLDQMEHPRPRRSRLVWVLLFVLAAVAAYAFSPFGPFGPGSDWPSDYQGALAASAVSGKPVLIEFSAPG